jgi:hypothetical protein
MKKLVGLTCLLSIAFILAACGGVSSITSPSGGGTGGISAHIEAIEERTTITADGAYNGMDSVVELPNGDWLLTYNKAVAHVTPYAVGWKRSSDQGATWSTEETAPWEGSPVGQWLSRTPGGDVFGVGQRAGDTVGYNRSSDGSTWSDYTISDMAFITQMLLDGSDMYASRYRATVPSGSTAEIWKSVDDGFTWNLLSTLREPGDAGVNETAICKLGTNRILAISRSDDETATYVKFSDDMGQTWGSQLDYTTQVGILQMPQLLNMGGFLLLIGRDGRNNRLVGFTSQDKGLTFVGKTILDTYTGNYIDGGYSWPLRLSDGRVFVAYYADSNNLQQPDIRSLKLRFGDH